MCSNDGSTPFSFASHDGHTEVVHVFSQHGADSGAHDNVNGMRPGVIMYVEQLGAR